MTAFSRFSMRPVVLAGLLASGLGAGSAHAADSLDRLRQLLQGTPEGGWVNASVGSYSAAWPTGSVATDVPNTAGPQNIVMAWSSFAWDTTRNQMVLWGGGHGNYAGNEIYLWNADTGLWSRGSLPSRVDSQGFVVDNGAPQSSHTYDNNVYLPVNDRFLTLGGAAWPTGGVYQAKTSDGSVVRTGPWLWNPNLADANKVGGTSGSGWDLSSQGGNMWANRQGQWTGTEVSGFQSGAYIYGSTTYRTENGADVVYVSVDPFQGGRPGLFRYTLGDVATGALDSWERVGTTNSAVIYGSAGTIDDSHNLYLRPTQRRDAANNLITDLAAWDLGAFTAGKPVSEQVIKLQLAGSGETLPFIEGMALEYVAATGDLYMFDGQGDGKVYLTRAAYDASGTLLDTWEVRELDSGSALFPTLTYGTGMYGKVNYVDALGAFVVLGEYDPSTLDAQVWMYKPYGVTAVPEPATMLLMSLGLAGLVGRGLRRKAGGHAAA